jgi:mannose-6-phosphate isomerase-like protein (cupin superfamily)
MIKKRETLQTSESQASRGGVGATERTPLLQPEEFFGKGRLFNAMRVPVGSSIGSHAHENEQEIYYFISGEGEFDDNGTLVPVSAGDVAICLPGTKHGLRNTGKNDLELVALILFTN